MFKSIKFEAVFKHPRKGHSGRFADEHKFEKGMTIIHGANEAGKSMRAELLRFALWGRRALRCKVSDYAKLVAEVEFTLKGKDYVVHRTKSDATLYLGDEAIATGTTPVNERIEMLFGYDMEVFDLANAVLQGEVEALGKMPPARRKALVDNLIGLGVIDETIQDLVDKRKETKASVATLASNLVPPQEPTEKVILSQDELDKFPSLKAATQRAVAIQNQLKGLSQSQSQLQPPKAPANPELATMYNEYRDLLDARQRAFKYAERMAEVKDTGMTLDEISEAYTAAIGYEASEDVECPACQEVFNLSGHSKPALTSKQCIVLREQQQRYNQRVEALRVSAKANLELNRFLSGYEAEDIIQAKQDVDNYNSDLVSYQRQLGRQQQAQEQIERLEHELFNLEKYSGDFDLYEKNYNESLTAQRLLGQYATYRKAYDTQLEKVEALKAEVENYDQAISGLRNLKVSIKSYLVPSLNKVASAYLSQMTDGARSSVVISETFDIVVDGQPMEALSGSAKAVANLAIRLALGQTLTNSVFSVLLADEIDAAMDKERSEYTAKCLKNLTNKISQIIVISHKKLEADNYVELT